MARHAAGPPSDEPPPELLAAAAPRGRRSLVPVAAVVAALALLIAATGWVVTRNRAAADGTAAGVGGAAAATPADGCSDTDDVLVATAPAMVGAVRDVIAATAPEALCGDVRVIDRSPQDALADLRAGGAQAPEIWIPDSTLWADRAQEAGIGLTPVGSLGDSPVAVVTSTATAEALGWTATPPSWAQALTTGRPLAVGELRSSAATTLALVAARREVGPDTAPQLTAGVSLSQQRAGVTSAADGLGRLDGADPAAWLVVTGTAEAAAVPDPDAARTVITPVGAVQPVLDHPILRLGPGRASVDSAVAALTSSGARTSLSAAGLTQPNGDQATRLTSFGADEAALDQQLSVLALPSRLLVVLDVSQSMAAPVSGDTTRIQVAAQALGATSGVLPDASEVELWAFANDVDGTKDYVTVLPNNRMDAVTPDGLQRTVVAQGLGQLPGQLRPGGTALYQVTLDAMRHARDTWRPDGISTVVVVTDGRNDDAGGPTLQAVTDALRAEGDPNRPVSLTAIAFGPDSDVAELQTLADAAKGWGYTVALDASDPASLQQLLINGLAARLQPAQTPPATP